MATFNKAVENNLEKLTLFVPIVARVHGDSHPEFHDVHKVFDEIKLELESSDGQRVELNDKFQQLRKITDDYTVPEDVCESYEQVYNMLAEIDSAYKA